MSVKRLQQFRRQCERQTGKPAHEIEFPLAHVLADVCAALRLSKRNTIRIVGRKGTQHLTTEREWTARLKK